MTGGLHRSLSQTYSRVKCHVGDLPLLITTIYENILKFTSVIAGSLKFAIDCDSKMYKDIRAIQNLKCEVQKL